MFSSLWLPKAAHCKFLPFWLIAAHRALCSPVSVVCIGSVYELDNYLVTLRLRQVNSGTSQLEYDMISGVTPRWLTNWILTDKSLFVSLTKALFCQLSIRTGTCDPEMFTDNKNKHNFCKHLASIMFTRGNQYKNPPSRFLLLLEAENNQFSYFSIISMFAESIFHIFKDCFKYQSMRMASFRWNAAE